MRSRPCGPSPSTWRPASRRRPGSRTPRRSRRSCGPSTRRTWRDRARPAAVEAPCVRSRASRGGCRMTAIEHRFGPYGGQYVPETLVPALVELEAAWLAAREDPTYRAELTALLNDYVGRPSPL